MPKSINSADSGLRATVETVFEAMKPPLGAMEGNGSYNRSAKIQGAGIAAALPLLEQTVQGIGLVDRDGPIVIADYGSSEGENSLVPLRLAIRAFRHRDTRERPILVFHVDLPVNDFNSLFEVLSCNRESYIQSESSVFSAAIGRSFYETVLPPGSVDFGWSSFAALWLSRIPALIPGHILPLRASGAVGAAFESQAAMDWEQFLRHRAVELRPGGRLMVVLPGVDSNGLVGLEPLFDLANDVLNEMNLRGHLTSNEREQMVIGSYPRRKTQLMAPFAGDGYFHALRVDAYHDIRLPDAAWLEFQNHGDAEALATSRARFFRSAFAPTLALALEPGRDRQWFATALEDGLSRRLAAWREPLHTIVQSLVLVKDG